MSWEDDQEFEAKFWGDCLNTFGEETKQLTYAHRMGLQMSNVDGHWPVYDLQGEAILDVGGGPSSMLLKCVNFRRGTVVDPCRYPTWVKKRYDCGGIDYFVLPGEDIGRFDPLKLWSFDEVWIYNVLQHVQDPEKIIRNVAERARLIRVFDWIDIPAHVGHPHELKAAELDRWLGGCGTIEEMNENGCVGRAYFGVFNGSI